jgi:hypothetical protein
MQLVKKVKAAQKNAASRGAENKGKTMQSAFNSSPMSLKKRAGSASASSLKLQPTERRGANGLTEAQENHLRILKDQLFSSNRQIQSLRHQIEDMRNNASAPTNSLHMHEAKRKIEMKLIEARQDLITVESDYHVKKDMFLRNKEFHQSLLDQYAELSDKKVELEKINRETVQAGS